MRRRIHAFESSIKGSIKTAFRELDVLLADTVADANDREGAVALEGEGSHIDYSIKGGATVITSLSEHGIAAQSKLLQEGDELLAVNGRPVTDQQHGTLLLREGEGEICLRVCLRPALVEVDLFKPQLSSKLGITLSNGDGADGGNTTIVSALADEGIAANSSAAVHLSTGVELRSVNGRPVLNHEQGTQLLKEACGHISLCVRTRPVTKDVRLFKPQQSSVLGITLTSLDGASILLEPVRLVEAPEPSVSASVALQMAPPTTRQQEVLLVDWVHRAAGAERVACSSCRGDACMAGVARAQSHGLATGMDGSLEEATPTELAWSLESPWASSRAVLFDIRTAAALERAWSEGAGAVLHITTPCDRREQEMVVDLTAMRATLISSGAELRVVRTSRCGSSSSDAPREAPPRIIAMQRGQSFDLGAWCAALPTGSECAPLIRRVALYKADRHSKLGITLTDDIRGVTTIAALDPDGIAARSGQAALAPADEVISVDGESVRGHAHATHLLKRACGEIVLRCRTPRAPLYSEAELQRMSEDDQLRAALMASQVQADAVEEPIRQRRRRALAKATPGDGVDARLIFSEDDERDRAELDPCSQCSVCSGAGIVSSLVEADAAAEIPCTIAGAEVPDYRCAGDCRLSYRPAHRRHPVCRAYAGSGLLPVFTLPARTASSSRLLTLCLVRASPSEQSATAKARGASPQNAQGSTIFVPFVSRALSQRASSRASSHSTAHAVAPKRRAQWAAWSLH